MDQPDIPWVPLAMVAIIFVRWLLGQFKRASRLREEQREKRRSGWDGKTPAHSPVYQPKKPVTPPPHPQPQRPAQPQTLQELFEMRRREIAEAQRRVTPPPVPVTKKIVDTSPPPEIFAPHISTQKRKKTIADPPPPRKKSSIVKAVSDRNQIRKAFILKEVLDKPKGLDL